MSCREASCIVWQNGSSWKHIEKKMFCILDSLGKLHGNSELFHARISFDSQIKSFFIGVPTGSSNYFNQNQTKYHIMYQLFNSKITFMWTLTYFPFFFSSFKIKFQQWNELSSFQVKWRDWEVSRILDSYYLEYL